MSKISSKLWDGTTQSLYIHAKLDGMFLRVTKNSEGVIRCESSIGTNLTHSIENCKPKWLVNLHKNLPLNSSILGELYYYDTKEKRGCAASYIKTGLANGENWFNMKVPIIDKRILRRKSLENVGTKQLRFAAFAIERGFEEIRLGNIRNNSPIEDVHMQALRLGVEFAPYVNVRKKLGQDFKIDREFLLNGVLQDFAAKSKGSIEGCMLKDANLLGWRKVKQENTIDCFPIGFVPGNGKYRGQVGSLRCAVYNKKGEIVEIATAGGFNEEVRRWLTDCYFNRNGLTEENIINQVIEIGYQLVGSQGRLRHPRLYGWRDDKLREECLTDQHPDLERKWG